MSICCIALKSLAIVYTPDNLPMPYLQDERRHTINPDGILSAETVATIDSLLYRAEHQYGVQAFCIVVGQVEGGDMFSFGIDLARKYKIGNAKQDTGLLFLLSTQDRSYYILTGHGLEGLLPDAICKRIENKYMLPYLKEGDWDNAMALAIAQTCSYFAGDETLKYEAEEEEEDEFAILVLVVIFILGFTFIVFGAAYQQSKCPKCGKHKLKKQSSILLSHKRGVKKKQVTYMCMNCGHLVQRIESEYEDDYHNPGGIIIGSGGFGGSHFGGGGGFSGGHFGGGSFGGGGAGGRF